MYSLFFLWEALRPPLLHRRAQERGSGEASVRGAHTQERSSGVRSPWVPQGREESELGFRQYATLSMRYSLRGNAP